MFATWLIATQGDPSALYLPPMGLAWGIANGLSVAFYIMYPKKLFARWGSFAVTGIGMFIGGIVAAAVYFGGVALGEPLALPALDAAGAAVFAAFVLVGTFAAFALYLHGVSVVGFGAGKPAGRCRAGQRHAVRHAVARHRVHRRRPGGVRAHDRDDFSW